MLTGIETAGLVLAVLPLLISALDAYKAGLRPIKTFFKSKFELESLIRCLKEQRWFFRTSVQVLLHAAAAVEEPSVAVDVLEVLQQPDVRDQIERYLEDAETLEFFDGVLAGYRSSVEAIIQKLGNIRRPNQTCDIAMVIAANPSSDGEFGLVQRLEFTMKHREMRRLVDQLDTCNDKLRKFIDRIDGINRTKRKDHSHQEGAKQMATSLHQVRRHAIALHAAIAAGWSSCGHPVHESYLILNCRIALGTPSHGTAKAICFHSVLACYARAGSQREACLETLVTVTNSSEAARASQQVTDLCTRMTQQALANNALMMHLAEECLHHDARSSSASHFDLRTPPKSVDLEQLVLRGGISTPRQKTRLALDLASSLLQLQTTPWIRKTWTKKVICFLECGNSDVSKIDCGRPFISRVFPESSALQAEHTVKTDLLELGILLLEIWTSRTFEAWAASLGFDVQDEYYAKMTRAIQWLEAETNFLTLSYSDAVSVCVRFSFEGVAHSWEHPAFRRAVCEKVIGALRDDCKAWIR